MPSISVSKSFSFEAAHTLPNHPGPCARLHGHSYRLEVSVHGELNDQGMVIDFDELRAVVHATVIDRLDHTFLNDLFDVPTAENVALAILDWLNGAGLSADHVTLHETATNSATAWS